MENTVRDPVVKANINKNIMPATAAYVESLKPGPCSCGFPDESIQHHHCVGNIKDDGGKIIDTAELREFETGAHRNSSAGKGDFSLIPPTGWHKVAIHFQNGAFSKGRNNWKKGIPSTALLDSAIRHIWRTRGSRSTTRRP